jgi:phosphatidylglycerol:prolipoprotein diacylglycerol transferase
MAAIGFLMGYYLIISRIKKYSIEKDAMSDILFYSIIAGIIGARLTYVFVNWDFYKKDFLEIFKIYNGGIVFYGGAVTAIIFGILFTKYIKKLNVLKVLDISSPGLTLGHAFGRIGCLLYGCCYGKTCSHSLPFGMKFPANSPAFNKQVHDGLINSNMHNSLSVYPTQIISALFLFFLTAILILFEKKWKKKDGQIFNLYLIAYSIFRFTIEFFRDYDKEFYFFNFISLSQIISLCIFVIGIIIFIRLVKTSK